MPPHKLTSVRFADARLSTGIRLHYAEHGDRAGNPVILLHGITDSWFSFSLALPLLSSAHRAWALDQRGHGDSERPSSGYAAQDFAGDVLAFMDAMDLERATLVGHSMGSLVALETAVAAPGRISRLVLIGSGAYIRSEDTLQLMEQFSRLDDPVPAETARDFQMSTIHHPIPDEFLERAVAESLKVPARVWRDALAGLLAVDYTDRLQDLRMPALLLRGDHDETFPQAAQKTLAARLPNATSRIYPDTGHALHWERPADFIRDLEKFLSHGVNGVTASA
ncbi:MAG TPA: alpha/beta hydrolase [Longimicrobiales bacterium]|nr:alpha/beta hydrolase [Longimicrobiales bacterium]